jgi:hypothetical protein
LAGSQDTGWRTVRTDQGETPADDALETVFEDGAILRSQSFDDVRKRAAAGLRRLTDGLPV